VLEEGSEVHVHRGDLGGCSCLIVAAKHFKIVLENVDELVGLKGFFNSVRNSVNEFFKFFCDVLILLGMFLHFRNEVFSVVLHACID
jgi:hypothetical protein